MKKLLTVANDGGMRAPVFRATFIFLLSVALGFILWVASLPVVHAAQMTPAEMIQSKLPPNKTIATATDAQLLAAVCKAVKQRPKDAVLIIRTAAGARKTLKSDLLCMATRCLREKRDLDCSWVSEILHDWIKAEPNEASRLTELVLQCAPECRDLFPSKPVDEGNFVNPPGNINVLPGSVGGGAGGNVCIACHNNREVQVACSDLDNFLDNHPGATTGPCQVTPSANR